MHFACPEDTWPLSDEGFPPSSGYRSSQHQEREMDLEETRQRICQGVRNITGLTPDGTEQLWAALYIYLYRASMVHARKQNLPPGRKQTQAETSPQWVSSRRAFLAEGMVYKHSDFYLQAFC